MPSAMWVATDLEPVRAGGRAARGVFLATLGLLLATHGGHSYAADSMIVHLTAVSIVDRGGLDLGPVWGAVKGPDGLSYGR